MKYFMLTATEDGKLVCAVYDSLAEISKLYSDDGLTLPTPINFIDVDNNYMVGKCCIIKGEVVMPKPIQFVTEWTET